MSSRALHSLSDSPERSHTEAASLTLAHQVASSKLGNYRPVVTTDQTRAHFGKPWKYVMGAGASAMLVSGQPDVPELEPQNHGYWTDEISDTLRPTSTMEVGNAGDSPHAYLDAPAGAYEHFLTRVGEVDFRSYFKKNIYHAPSGGMTFRAHRALLRQQGRFTAREAGEDFEELETRRNEQVDSWDFEVDLTGQDGLFARAHEASGRLVLEGVSDYRRKYRRS